MEKITDLDDAALAWLLDTLEKHPENKDEVKRLVHDLFVHRVELEQQNRELQAVQVKLEESRDRYADLYDFAPVAYVTLDALGSIEEINLAGAGLLGKERQSLIGASLAGFAEPGSRRVVLSFLRRLQENDDLHTEVFSITGADGRTSVVRAQGRAEPPARLRHVALVDVTATEQAEQALAMSEDCYRVLGDHTGDMVSRHDASGVYLYVSPSCLNLLGYQPEELLGRTVFECFHPDDLDAIHDLYAAVVPSSAMFRCRMRHRDGSYAWFEVRSMVAGEAENGGHRVIVAQSGKLTEPAGRA